MYTINGVSLDDPRYGWIYRRGSQPFITLSADVASVKIAGKRGVTQFPTGVTAGMWTCVVNTPWEHKETLNALFGQQTLELAAAVTPNRVAAAQFRASEVDTIYNADGSTDMRYTLELLDAAWRDRTAKTLSAPISDASVRVDGILPGLSAPVQDALVRVKGACTGLQVTDSAGSWFTYAGSLSATQYLRFECATGRAFVTGSDTWSGGTEVSGDIDFGGPSGLFEVSPAWSTDPSVRAGALTVATATRSGASVQVRGKGAFIV